MKECKLDVSRSFVKLSILCDVDHHTAKVVREAVDKSLEENKPELLIMDFSSVSFMDSSGIGLVLGRVNKAEELGCAVKVVGLCPRLYCLMKLSGISRLKGLTLEAASVEKNGGAL